jgi:hypothetical protein
VGTLIKREFITFYIKSPLATLVKLGIVLFISPSIVFQMKAFGQKPEGIIIVELFAIALTMLIGMQNLAVQFYREKLIRNIEVLLALGFSPFRVWLSKMISIWIVVYVLYLIGITCAFFVGNMLVGLDSLIHIDALFLLIVLVFAPLIGFSMLGFLGVLQLVLSDVRMVNLVTMLGAILFLVFVPRFAHVIPLVTIATSLFPFISIVVAGCITFVSWGLLRIVPPEKYLQ